MTRLRRAEVRGSVTCGSSGGRIRCRVPSFGHAWSMSPLVLTVTAPSVRGVPAGGAVPARAPGGGATGVADRDAPSVGFVHGMFKRTAGLLTQTHDRIRTLITLAYARVLRRDPAAGRTPQTQAG